jgi:ATPase subunit of ABC transporter with duplicated ATPase domains
VWTRPCSACTWTPTPWSTTCPAAPRSAWRWRGAGGRTRLLLLDEPTNHLDIDAIEWLQDLLNGWRGALVLISHDRAFIDAVATRIVELDRGQLRSYPGNFAAFEAAKVRELGTKALAAPAPTSCWRRKRCGSARAWKRAARAAWAACSGW